MLAIEEKIYSDKKNQNKKVICELKFQTFRPGQKFLN